VPRNAPFGHCPRCLIQLGFGPLPDEVPPPPLPTRFIGEYELLEQIGRGGMGVVYKARQVSLNRLVALKMLSPHGSAFPGLIERIRLEAEAAGSLHYPHIVTIYDVGEHEGQPFFSMELIEGTSIAKAIGSDGFCLTAGGKQRPSSGLDRQRIIARTMSQIARAVNRSKPARCARPRSCGTGAVASRDSPPSPPGLSCCWSRPPCLP
jgi:serine/threonine protein kinase